MTKQLKSAWDKTAGYKTKSGAILLGLYELAKLVAPQVLDGNTDIIVRKSIDVLIITGGLDWLYRNRKEIVNWVLNLFTKKQ
ncbi:MAG TPA: hypothetical protein VN192_04820 [Flavobacterium sp.]|nr:hypothetical protein [Flavobacterium sp.]